MLTQTENTMVAPPQAMELFNKDLQTLERDNPKGITVGQILSLANQVTKRYNEFIQRHNCTASSS